MESSPYASGAHEDRTQGLRQVRPARPGPGTRGLRCASRRVRDQLPALPVQGLGRETRPRLLPLGLRECRTLLKYGRDPLPTGAGTRPPRSPPAPGPGGAASPPAPRRRGETALGAQPAQEYSRPRSTAGPATRGAPAASSFSAAPAAPGHKPCER